MNLLEFCKGISLADEGIEIVTKISETDTFYEQLRNEFKRNRDNCFKEILKMDVAEEYFLYFYCRMACETWEEYKKKEISEKIFFDTFSDITIWCENSRRRFGNYVLREYGWLWRHVEMMIFRLGRLQFEKMDSEWDADLGDIHIRKGKPVISVHIPEGYPLDHTACEKSFRQAYEFWGTELPYVCHSWLLGAELRIFLSEDSNIMKFQQFFDIVEVDYSIREGEERIFGRLQENPELYEGDTSLQKKAKQHLVLGGRLGSGLGILKK